MNRDRRRTYEQVILVFDFKTGEVTQYRNVDILAKHFEYSKEKMDEIVSKHHHEMYMKQYLFSREALQTVYDDVQPLEIELRDHIEKSDVLARDAKQISLKSGVPMKIILTTLCFTRNADVGGRTIRFFTIPMPWPEVDIEKAKASRKYWSHIARLSDDLIIEALKKKKGLTAVH